MSKTEKKYPWKIAIEKQVVALSCPECMKGPIDGKWKSVDRKRGWPGANFSRCSCGQLVLIPWANADD